MTRGIERRLASAARHVGPAVAALLLPAVLSASGCGSSGDTDRGLEEGGLNLFDDAGAGGEGGGAFLPDASSADATFTAPDCAGCTFPALGASSCAATAPPIKLVYPVDGVLVPPNMGVISVQWTPFGSAYSEFEVDFENSITDTRIITKCATETVDTGQPPAPSGGCELDLTAQEWAVLVDANRGGEAVTITVRGTTNGTCASTSEDSVKMSFASQDLLGAIYYWKSTVSSNGTGGQIWVKSFGDSNPEQQVTGTGGALAASCNGCHALSRDGLRMVVYSDDDDSDDEYSDVTGSLIDMTTKAAIGTAYAGRGTGQPPGFSTLSPTHAEYLTSDGLGTSGAGATNNFTLWNGNTGTQTSTITVGTAGMRPTMPDWSPDGTSVIYVLPKEVASWDQGGGGGPGGGGPGGGGAGGGRNDDDHEFGGSLYTIPYQGNNQFGTPSVFLPSSGENNYYPSYSPDGQFVVFDRVALNTTVAAADGCVGTSPEVSCPNDSFSNPAARLMLMANLTGSMPMDLQNANGSPAAAPLPLSNSWPRWSPFVQTYRGNRLLWVAFSSTRDYGVRVRNHLQGMYQCYPPDSYELAGGAHHTTFAAACQQPKLWMAAINLSEVKGVDPSFPAFLLPFQDITTHNHTPQWTQEVVTMPLVDAGTCVPTGGSCQQNPTACCAPLECNGDGTCGMVLQ
ncbi:MAG: hypothetical protein ACLP1X_15665 [Polyangiaceae bacterium]